MGMDPVVAPLFTIVPLAWEAPVPGIHDAILLTSANAARHAGSAAERFSTLPCFVVGEATASAAREAGFTDVRTGPSDGGAAAVMMAEAGVKRALHLCGRDRIDLQAEGVCIDAVPAYGAEAASELPPEAGEALGEGAVVLVHSPRAGARLAELVGERSRVTLAAISEAAAAAAGEGWAAKAVAPAPRDEALLELAAKLCNHAPPEGEHQA
jgi:uroporphyrinogen-III synthase